MEALTCGPQGRKVISSRARSLPQPPGALLRIRTTTSFTAGGVLNESAYCFHAGELPADISPVLSVSNLVPVNVSMEKVRFGFMPLLSHALGFKTFTIQAANSKVVLAHKPRTVST